jgi:hypothetical protein
MSGLAAATLFFPLFWDRNMGAYFYAVLKRLKGSEAAGLEAKPSKLALACETFARTRAY